MRSEPYFRPLFRFRVFVPVILALTALLPPTPSRAEGTVTLRSETLACVARTTLERLAKAANDPVDYDHQLKDNLSAKRCVYVGPGSYPLKSSRFFFNQISVPWADEPLWVSVFDQPLTHEERSRKQTEFDKLDDEIADARMRQAVDQDKCIQLYKKLLNASLPAARFETGASIEKRCRQHLTDDLWQSSINSQADALLELGKPLDAIRTAERYVSNGRSVQCFLALGKGLMAVGRMEEAKAAFQESKNAAKSETRIAERLLSVASTDKEKKLYAYTIEGLTLTIERANKYLAVLD